MTGLYSRIFFIVVLSGPEIDLKESISEFELAAFSRSLFNSDGNLRHCVGKSKLMNVVENLLPQQLSDGQTEQRHDEGSVVTIDGMEIIQSMGKPTWVRNGCDLANHFLEIIENRSKECEEVQVIFDRYDIPNPLNERTRQFLQGSSRPMVYHIFDDAVIEKITLKQLLSSNINKESLAIYFASHILQCNTDSRKTSVVTTKGECKSSKLSVEHLSSTQEEADTHDSARHRCHRKRSNIPLYPEPRHGRFGTGFREVHESLRRTITGTWHRSQVPINPTAPSVQRFRTSRRSSFTWFPRIHWL